MALYVMEIGFGSTVQRQKDNGFRYIKNGSI